MVPDQASITAIGAWFVKGFGVLTFLPPVTGSLALRAESSDCTAFRSDHGRLKKQVFSERSEVSRGRYRINRLRPSL